MSEPAWSAHCGDQWREHVLVATGYDICDVLGESPRRARDWVAMMRRLGVRNMTGVIGAVHGPPIPYRRAMRGDIVQRGWAIGICRGDKAEFFGGDMVPMREVDFTWALGTTEVSGFTPEASVAEAVEQVVDPSNASLTRVIC